jgi:carbon monoxide dehydrogenase subunit G
MELTHQFTVPADVHETWAAFNDIGSIASCFPGATLTSVEGDEFQGAVKIRLGPISMQYAGTASFVERDLDSRRLVIKAHGKDKRGQGTADATVTARLVEVTAGTQVDVLTELAITGKPAQFGRGMIQDVSERLLSQFVDRVSDQLSGRGSDDPDASVTSATDTTASAAGSAAAHREPSAAAASTELNLASTVLPVLARRAAPLAATALIFLVIGRRLGRRR